MDQQTLNTEIVKDIPAFMNKLFGEGNWLFDETENLYIAGNAKYQGPGFGFIAVRPDGSFFTGVRPQAAVQ